MTFPAATMSLLGSRPSGSFAHDVSQQDGHPVRCQDLLFYTLHSFPATGRTCENPGHSSALSMCLRSLGLQMLWGQKVTALRVKPWTCSNGSPINGNRMNSNRRLKDRGMI